jgi:hypothetical protein
MEFVLRCFSSRFAILPFLLLYRSQSKMSGGLKNYEPKNFPVDYPYQCVHGTNKLLMVKRGSISTLYCWSKWVLTLDLVKLTDYTATRARAVNISQWWIEVDWLQTLRVSCRCVQMWTTTRWVWETKGSATEFCPWIWIQDREASIGWKCWFNS